MWEKSAIRASFCASVCDTASSSVRRAVIIPREFELSLSHVKRNPCTSAAFGSRAVREVDTVSQRIILEGKELHLEQSRPQACSAGSLALMSQPAGQDRNIKEHRLCLSVCVMDRLEFLILPLTHHLFFACLVLIFFFQALKNL